MAHVCPDSINDAIALALCNLAIRSTHFTTAPFKEKINFNKMKSFFLLVYFFLFQKNDYINTHNIGGMRSWGWQRGWYSGENHLLLKWNMKHVDSFTLTREKTTKEFWLIFWKFFFSFFSFCRDPKWNNKIWNCLLLLPPGISLKHFSFISWMQQSDGCWLAAADARFVVIGRSSLLSLL